MLSVKPETAHVADARFVSPEFRRVVLAVLFLRYVVFEDPEISKRVNAERRQRRKRARSRSLGGGGENGLDRSSRGEMDPRRLAGGKDKNRGTVSYYVRAKIQGGPEC